MTTFRLLPQVILRTPLFSYSDYWATVGDDLLQNPLFRAAIYFASPAFYRLLAARDFQTALFNEKVLFSLGKYYNRMSFRPTPFGMFSAFSLTSWGDEKRIVVSRPGGINVSVQADQELSILAGQVLDSDLIQCAYFINPTIYRLGADFRFVKSVLRENSTKLEFSLDSLELNGLTKKLVGRLKKTPLDGGEIIRFLQAETGCSVAAATDYLNFLKDSQVIIGTSGPNITGTDYFSSITTVPQSDFRLTGHLVKRLPGYQQRFHKDLVRSAESCAISLKEALDGLQRKTPEKLFYVNSERPVESGTLDNKYQQFILEAISALTHLSPTRSVPLLEQFIIDFKNRFGDRRIPLLQAMDPDAGIGYGNLVEISDRSKLLKDIPFGNQPYVSLGPQWSAVHQLLLKKWTAVKANNEPILLHTSDLEALPKPGADLPPSTQVLFRITEGKVFIESAGGATGTSLIGRFTPFSKQVAALSREIALHEIGSNPGVVFAELAQLSDHHVDNVNRRLNSYDYEIPINSISLMEPEQQIGPGELVVYLQKDELVLESAQLKKRVIPRLSSAFNYQHNNLPIFRFLCDLQFQSVHAALSLDLENYFPGMDHYPRVEFEGTILALAKWHLKKEDFQPLISATHSEKMKAVIQLREKFQLPSVIAFTSADQQLVFNLENENHLTLFSGCVSGMNEVTLQEFLLPLPPLSQVVTPEDKPVINQFIAFVVNDHAVFHPAVNSVKSCRNKSRDFILGTNWLYFKIYCTPAAANDLLRSKILPVLRELSKEGPLKWFFVRYTDPGNHIRIRIKVDDVRISKVVLLLKARFSGLVGNDSVKDYMAGTYRRELERYGEDMIDACEEFFNASSELVLHFIKNNESTELPVDALQLAISSVGPLLERMVPTIDEQILFLESITDSFLAEFKMEKRQLQALDKAYRKLRPDFAILSGAKAFYKRLKMKKYLDQYMHEAGQIFVRTQRFTPERKNQLLANLIHMHLNRVFTDRQRKQEMVLYYCFLKYKLSERARIGKAAAD